MSHTKPEGEHFGPTFPTYVPGGRGAQGARLHAPPRSSTGYKVPPQEADPHHMGIALLARVSLSYHPDSPDLEIQLPAYNYPALVLVQMLCVCTDI